MKISVYDGEGRRKDLTVSEGRKFARLTEGLSDEKRAICLVIYFTGCRISEAITLTPKSPDLATNTIQIRSLKKRKRKHFRRIPIPETLTKLLISLAERSDKNQFWSLSRSTVWRAVKKS